MTWVIIVWFAFIFISVASLSLRIEEDLVFNAVQNLTHTFSNLSAGFLLPDYTLMLKYRVSLPTSSTDPSFITKKDCIIYPADEAYTRDNQLSQISMYVNQAFSNLSNPNATSCYYKDSNANLYYVGDVYISMSTGVYTVYKWNFKDNLPSQVYDSLLSAESVSVQCNNMMQLPNTLLSDRIDIHKYLSLNYAPVTFDIEFAYEPTESLPMAAGAPRISVPLDARLIQQAVKDVSVDIIKEDNNPTQQSLLIKFTPRDIGILHVNLPMNGDIGRVDGIPAGEQLSIGRIIMNPKATKVHAVSTGPVSSRLAPFAYNDFTPISDWSGTTPLILLNTVYDSKALFVSWPLLVLAPGEEITVRLSLPVPYYFTSPFVAISAIPLGDIFNNIQKNGRPYVDPRYLLGYAPLPGLSMPMWESTVSPSAADASKLMPRAPLVLGISSITVDSSIFSLPQITSTTGRQRALKKVSVTLLNFQVAKDRQTANPGSTFTFELYPQIIDEMGFRTFLTPSQFKYTEVDTSSLSNFPSLAQEESTTISYNIPSSYVNADLIMYLPMFSSRTHWSLPGTLFLLNAQKSVIEQWDLSGSSVVIDGSSNTSPALTFKFSPSAQSIEAVNAANSAVTSETLSTAVTTFEDIAFDITYLISPSTNTALSSYSRVDENFGDSPLTIEGLAVFIKADQFLDPTLVLSGGSCSARLVYLVNDVPTTLSSYPALSLKKFVPANVIEQGLEDGSILPYLVTDAFPTMTVDSNWSGNDVKLIVSCYFPKSLVAPLSFMASETFASLRLRPNRNGPLLQAITDTSSTIIGQYEKYLSIFTSTNIDSSNSIPQARLIFRGAMTLTATTEQQLLDMLYSSIWSTPKDILSNTLVDSDILRPDLNLEGFKSMYVLKLTQFSVIRHNSLNYQIPLLTFDPQVSSRPFVGPVLPFELITVVTFTGYKVKPTDLTDFSNNSGFTKLAPLIDPKMGIRPQSISYSPDGRLFTAYYTSLRLSLKALQGVGNTNTVSRSEWSRLTLLSALNHMDTSTFNQHFIETSVITMADTYYAPATTYRFDNPCFLRPLGTCGAKAVGPNTRTACPIACPLVTQDPAFRYPVPQSSECQLDFECGRLMSLPLPVEEVCDKRTRRCTLNSNQSNDLLKRYQESIGGNWYSSFTFPYPSQIDASELYTAQQNDINANQCSSASQFAGYRCSIPPVDITDLSMTPHLMIPNVLQSGDSFTFNWHFDGKASTKVTIQLTLRDQTKAENFFTQTLASVAAINEGTTITIPTPLPTTSSQSSSFVAVFTLTTQSIDPTYLEEVKFTHALSLSDITILATCQGMEGSTVTNKCKNNASCTLSTGLCNCPSDDYTYLDNCTSRKCTALLQCDKDGTASCNFSSTPNTPRCVCNTGYSGDYCQKPPTTSGCPSTLLRCQNGGSSQCGDTQCTCKNQFNGPLCQTCPITCSMNGKPDTKTCSTCLCKVGFSGPACNCEAKEGSTTLSKTPQDIIKMNEIFNSTERVDAVSIQTWLQHDEAYLKAYVSSQSQLDPVTVNPAITNAKKLVQAATFALSADFGTTPDKVKIISMKSIGESPTIASALQIRFVVYTNCAATDVNDFAEVYKQWLESLQNGNWFSYLAQAAFDDFGGAVVDDIAPLDDYTCEKDAEGFCIIDTPPTTETEAGNSAFSHHIFPVFIITLTVGLMSIIPF